MKYQIQVLMAGALMLAPLVFSEPLEAELSRFQSFSADFVQSGEGSKSAKSSSGHLWIQKPGAFRWEVSAPNAEVFVSDGHQFWRYEPDLAQVIEAPVSEGLSETPLLLLSGQVKNLNQVFEVKTLEPGHFELRPKTQDGLIQSIELVFKNDVLTRFTLTSTLGQTTQVDFSKVSLNAAISPQLFEFKVPPGVDVLKSQ
ncbi:MAG: outer membrane lipoprotein carrier protein LolA [Gammaproteobacteria bacterium]|nr:outer membrane lipoprotein carrier protein LolA [Gammaproteobacteria bacterium]